MSKKWDFTLSSPLPSSLPDPPGFRFPPQHEEGGTVQASRQRKAELKEALKGKSWDLVTGPVKGMGMQLFMLWMMGSGVGIFSILMIGYAGLQCVSTLLKLNQVFVPLEKQGVSCVLQKVAYFFLNLAMLLYISSKAADSGILPIYSGDWVAFIPDRVLKEKVLKNF